MEARRATVLSNAIQELAAGNVSAALARASQAEALRSGPDTQRLTALTHLLRRDFAQAWSLHRAATR